MSAKVWGPNYPYCQFHFKWFLQISKREKSKSIPPVLYPLFIETISWRSEFDTNKHFAIIPTNQRIPFDDVVSLSWSRAEPPMNRPYRRGVYFLISLPLRFVKTIPNEIDNILKNLTSYRQGISLLFYSNREVNGYHS